MARKRKYAGSGGDDNTKRTRHDGQAQSVVDAYEADTEEDGSDVSPAGRVTSAPSTRAARRRRRGPVKRVQSPKQKHPLAKNLEELVGSEILALVPDLYCPSDMFDPEHTTYARQRKFYSRTKQKLYDPVHKQEERIVKNRIACRAHMKERRSKERMDKIRSTVMAWATLEVNKSVSEKYEKAQREHAGPSMDVTVAATRALPTPSRQPSPPRTEAVRRVAKVAPRQRSPVPKTCHTEVDDVKKSTAEQSVATTSVMRATDLADAAALFQRIGKFSFAMPECTFSSVHIHV